MCNRVFIRTDLLALDQSKTFYKPDWFDIVGAEVKCCKEAVCIIDMSSFTKFELTVSADCVLWEREGSAVCDWCVCLCQSAGDQALRLLQRLCANDLDVPVGHIVHTGMLNHRGGYENDCSVVRLSTNRCAGEGWEPHKKAFWGLRYNIAIRDLQHCVECISNRFSLARVLISWESPTTGLNGI